MEKNLEKSCEVCQNILNVDVYKQGKCPNCGWWNCILNEENPELIAILNLISLNKAKQLYNANKPLEPDLDEFIEALNKYSEMQFKYQSIIYAVELVFSNKKNIRLYNSQTKESLNFSNDEDFKNNAKVGGKFLKDIWNETTERDWCNNNHYSCPKFK